MGGTSLYGYFQPVVSSSPPGKNYAELSSDSKTLSHPQCDLE